MSEAAFYREFSDRVVGDLMDVVERQFPAAMSNIDSDDFDEFRKEMVDTLAQACEDELL